jgi:hypothetical protein
MKISGSNASLASNNSLGFIERILPPCRRARLTAYAKLASFYGVHQLGVGKFDARFASCG